MHLAVKAKDHIASKKVVVGRVWGEFICHSVFLTNKLLSHIGFFFGSNRCQQLLCLTTTTAISGSRIPQGLLDHVDVEGRVRIVLQLLEVTKDLVGCWLLLGSKNSLKNRDQILALLRKQSFSPQTLRREENSDSL